jgi:hypothetical protein
MGPTMSTDEIDQATREWPSSVPAVAPVGPRKVLHDLGDSKSRGGLAGTQKGSSLASSSVSGGAATRHRKKPPRRSYQTTEGLARLRRAL